MKDTDLANLLKLNPFEKTEYYPIKSKILNGLLGGKGLPKGSVLHIAGGSGTGKSTMVLHDLCLDLLKQGLDVAYIDADRGINTEIMQSTGIAPYYKNTDKKLGGCFLAFRKTTFSEINDLMQELAAAGVQVIVIDTLAIIDSGMYMGKDSYNIENMRVGGEASKLRQLMKNINVLSEKDSRRINFILLNHTAKEIGGMSFGPPKEAPKGGEAPIQYSDIVIQLMRYSSKAEMFNGKPIGQKVFAEVVKSRHATGKVKTPFFIRYGKGISNILTYKEIFEAGKANDPIGLNTQGRTYFLRHPDLTEEVKYVGKDNIITAIKDNYSIIDRCFSAKDWMIDVSQESNFLDVEFSFLDDIKLPKELSDMKIVTAMGMDVYFLTGIDIHGQKYGVYYNRDNKKLYKEFNSCQEVISLKSAQEAIDEINDYLKEIQEEQDNKSVDQLLDEVDLDDPDIE